MPLHTSVLSPDCARDVAVWRRRRELSIWFWFRFFDVFNFMFGELNYEEILVTWGGYAFERQFFAVSFWRAVCCISKWHTKSSERTSKRKDFMPFRKNRRLKWFRAIIGMYCENHWNTKAHSFNKFYNFLLLQQVGPFCLQQLIKSCFMVVTIERCKIFRSILWTLWNIAYDLEGTKSRRMILVSLAVLSTDYGLRTLPPSTCRLVSANKRCADVCEPWLLMTVTTCMSVTGTALLAYTAAAPWLTFHYTLLLHAEFWL